MSQREGRSETGPQRRSQRLTPAGSRLTPAGSRAADRPTPTRQAETGAHRISTERLMASHAELDMQTIESARLSIYRLIFPLGIAALTIVSLLDLTRGVLSPFQIVFHPILAIIFGLCIAALWWRPAHLRAVEVTCFVTVCIYFVGELYTMVYRDLFLGEAVRLDAFPQWLPMVYFAAFLVFPTRRQALQVSIAFVVALLLPGLLYLAAFGWASATNSTFSVLLQIYFAHAIYIPMLSGIALLKEQFVNATTIASMMASVASVDYLTGIANRRAVEYALRQAIEQSRRYSRPLAVIIFDIDWFKRVNDTFGHKVGDQVLIRVARIVRANLRAGDTLGRWGGEEFLIVCPDTTITRAILLADRLRQIIEHEQFIGSSTTTVSMGVAAMQPDDLADTLVQRADTALYQAKQRGRNRVEVVLPSG